MGEPLQIIKLLPPATAEYKSQMVLDLPILTNLLNKANDIPFAILSISGQARQGKSYFLSCLIKYLQCLENNKKPTIDLEDNAAGFTFINGTEAVTSGVWMWSEPFFIEQDDGSRLAIYLLDSQGLFDKYTGHREWTGLAGIALLTSSCLIYNTVHSLKEEILQLFTTFCESTSTGSDKNDDHHFQKLIFLIRDFNYPDQYDYGTVGGQKYIDMRLTSDPMKDSTEACLCKKLLKKSFHDGIECCVLPSPGEAAKRRTFKGALSQLEPKFANKMSRFIEKLTMPLVIPVKKAIASDCPMTTTEFISLLKNFTNAFNSYDNLNSESLVEINIQASNESVLEQSLRSYLVDMKKIDMSKVKAEWLQEHHNSRLDMAIKKFQTSKKFGSKEVHENYERILVHKITLAFAIFKANHEKEEINLVSKAADNTLSWFSQELEALARCTKLNQFEETANNCLSRALLNFEEKLKAKVGQIRQKDIEQINLQLKLKAADANENLKKIVRTSNSYLENASAILKNKIEAKLMAIRQEFGEFVSPQGLKNLVEAAYKEALPQLFNDLRELKISDEDINLIASKLKNEANILAQEISNHQCARDKAIKSKICEILKAYENNLFHSPIEQSVLQTPIFGNNIGIQNLESYLRESHLKNLEKAKLNLEETCRISDIKTLANYRKELDNATTEHFNKYLEQIKQIFQSINETFCAEQAKAATALSIELHKTDNCSVISNKYQLAAERNFQNKLTNHVENPLIQKLSQKMSTEFNTDLHNTMENVKETHAQSLIMQQKEIAKSMETAISIYDSQLKTSSKFTPKEHYEAKQKALEKFEIAISHIPKVGTQYHKCLNETMDSKWDARKKEFDTNAIEFQTKLENELEKLINNFKQDIKTELYDDSGEKLKILLLTKFETVFDIERKKIRLLLKTFCINNKVESEDYLNKLEVNLTSIKFELQKDFQMEFSKYKYELKKVIEKVTEEYEFTIKQHSNEFDAESQLVITLINKVLIHINTSNLKLVLSEDKIRNEVLETLKKAHSTISKNLFGFGTQPGMEIAKVEPMEEGENEAKTAQTVATVAIPSSSGTSSSSSETTKSKTISKPVNSTKEISTIVDSFKEQLENFKNPCSGEEKEQLQKGISKIIQDFPPTLVEQKSRLKNMLDTAYKTHFKKLDDLRKIELQKQEELPKQAFDFYISEFEKLRNSTKFVTPKEINDFHKNSIYQALSNFELTREQLSRFGKLSNAYHENLLLELAKSSETEPAIGIDLGTTFSCVSIFWEGKMTVIPNEVGRKTTPSYVAFKEDDSVIVGEAAKSRSFLDPENTIFDAKRLIGRNFEDPEVQKDMTQWPFKVVEERGMTKIEVRGKTYYPEQIGAKILIELKKVAENFIKRQVTNAVITVPAYFNDGQRQATRDAGAIAGLNVIRIINEPTAAAFAYSLEWPSSVSRKILIFDFGGGTFDISILAMSSGRIKTLGVHGDTHMGGEDVDSNLVKYCAQKFKEETKIDLLENKNSSDPVLKGQVNRRLRRLRHICEQEKINLSPDAVNSVKIELPAIYNKLDLNVELTKNQFEQLNAPIFDKAIALVKQALAEVRLPKEEIDEIVLVGGSTRIPKVRKMLENLFVGKKINCAINPDEAVACGAALQAAILTGNMESQRKLHGLSDEHTGIVALEVSDVTPYGTGVELLNGRLSTIIPKNSPVPIQKTEKYLTAYDNQTSVLIIIYEGEKPIAANNHKVGEFYLNGIPPGKAGAQQIEVTLSIDDEGILHMTGVCHFKGIRTELVVREHKGRISAREKRSLIEII